MQILIEWFREPKNFNRYKGVNGQKGETKESLCGEVVSIMQKNGIFHREKKDIRNRIQHIQASFKAALEWKNNTGSGIEDSLKAKGESEESIAKTIKGKNFNAVFASTFFFIIKLLKTTQ